jgi:polar amino acid transport system substrate-binding protein
LRGFDIDLMRLIAEKWGSEIEFLQVTRENALDRLNRGQVHAVASAFVRYRDLDEQLEFSQTYLIGRQAMMVRADSPQESLSDLSSHPIGYVVGTRTEKALSLWSARLDESLNLKHYLTLDRAFSALTRGEIEGLAAEEQKLLNVSRDYADRVRILDEAVAREPHAVAVRRHDIAMRRLLSRSIQLLAKDKTLQMLHREYFPETEYPEDAFALWDGIGEELNPAQYSGELRYPTRYTVPHVLRTGVLRVGGISGDLTGGSTGREQLTALNRALVHELGRRWAVSVEVISSSADEAIELLTRGEADIVAGLKPDWRLASTMDFSVPYLLHGDRLMVRANSQIAGFNDLRGRIIGVIVGDDGARDRAQAWADSINASVRFFQTREDGATLNLLEFNNANAIYADSLLLVSHLQASPRALRLTDRWYSRSFYTFGLPYNDLDFRLLVDYTLQELVRDGTLWELSASLILSDAPPDFEITPGAAVFAGIGLEGS